MKKTSIQHHEIIVDHQRTRVVLRKVARAKSIRIQVSSGTRILVTGPGRISFRALEDFFKKHQDWAEQKLLHFRRFPNKSIKLSEELYKAKKEKARALVVEKVAYWSKYYQLHPKRITIRNQSTRWGSCSSKGTLSFHAAIIDLPPELQDYLVVHELCHLPAMNHSAKFWALVERSMPKAKQLDARLKKYDSVGILEV